MKWKERVYAIEGVLVALIRLCRWCFYVRLVLHICEYAFISHENHLIIENISLLCRATVGTSDDMPAALFFLAFLLIYMYKYKAAYVAYLSNNPIMS